eukprot:TRINITY_DN34540_c0_g1_i1.p1 TRINITY_DN34540_c0_g1~~TRINITY_DN34540_c0_g1_i1.p1  ORF type:complete len:611 (+),score=120.97 TRINITY_DN34540_c0_g1_i1:156-1988(+)
MVAEISRTPNRKLDSALQLRLTPVRKFRGPFEQGGVSSARSAASSWGSSVAGCLRTPVKKSGPRIGETSDFGTPLRSEHHAEKALAGLRLFVKERFGGVQKAFDRMDFHRDGRVSCLEFQEVLAGQERYCSLQEARDLFCLLARGSPARGWLQKDVFEKQLGGQTDVENVKGQLFDHSPESASHALRSLLLGQAALGRRGDADAEVDEVATTVQSLTSRSSASALPCASRCSLRPGRCDDFGASMAAEEEALVPMPFSGRGGPAGGSGEETGSFSSASLAQRLFAGAMGTRTTWQGGEVPNSSFNKARQTAALQSLDEGLLSLRSEVAALQAMQPGAHPQRGVLATPPAQCWTMPCQETHAGLPLSTDYVPPAKIPAAAEARVVAMGLKPPPGGLAWIFDLPWHTQGRLAACTSPSEALEVLDEAVPHGAGDEVHSTPTLAQLTGTSTSPEIVAAAMGLLEKARTRVQELEAMRDERRRKNEEDLAALRQWLSRERHKSLRRLLEKLAPPRVSEAPQGSLPPELSGASPGPASSRRSQSSTALHRNSSQGQLRGAGPGRSQAYAQRVTKSKVRSECEEFRYRERELEEQLQRGFGKPRSLQSSLECISVQ